MTTAAQPCGSGPSARVARGGALISSRLLRVVLKGWGARLGPDASSLGVCATLVFSLALAAENIIMHSKVCWRAPSTPPLFPPFAPATFFQAEIRVAAHTSVLHRPPRTQDDGERVTMLPPISFFDPLVLVEIVEPLLLVVPCWSTFELWYLEMAGSRRIRSRPTCSLASCSRRGRRYWSCRRTASPRTAGRAPRRGCCSASAPS